MKIGNVVQWKNSGDIGTVVKIKGDYVKMRYDVVLEDDLVRKISDWIPINELIIIKND